MRDRSNEQISRIAFARIEIADDGRGRPVRPSVPHHQVGLTNDASRSPRRHLNITECLSLSLSRQQNNISGNHRTVKMKSRT